MIYKLEKIICHFFVHTIDMNNYRMNIMRPFEVSFMNIEIVCFSVQFLDKLSNPSDVTTLAPLNNTVQKPSQMEYICFSYNSHDY